MSQTQGQKCRNICHAIDLYGVNPNLLIFGNQKYSSILGSFLTIIASALTFGYLVQQVQELVLKQLPQTIVSENLVTETSPFALENHNFTLSISVGNMQQNPLKTIDKYFTIKVENCLRAREFNTTTNKIDVVNTCITYPTEACTPDNFVTDIQKEYFSKIRLGTVQCIKKDILQSKPPVKIQNIFRYYFFKFFVNMIFRIQQLINKLSSNNTLRDNFRKFILLYHNQICSMQKQYRET